jgi:prevent-host-death family protein
MIMPETTTMNVTEARAQFSALLNRVFRGEQRVIIEKNGIPVAALISAGHLERLERYEALDIADRKRMLEEMREAFADLTTEEIEEQVARSIQVVREEQRSSRLSQSSS